MKQIFLTATIGVFLAGAAGAADCRPGPVLGANEQFAPLGKGGIATLAIASRPVDLRRDDVLIQRGDKGDSLYVVGRGRLVVRIREGGKDIEVARPEPGGLVGEFMLLDSQDRTATVVAAEDSCVVEVTRRALAPLLVKDAELARRFARVIAERQGDASSFNVDVLAERIRTRAAAEASGKEERK
ncbi:MAG: cyclic nucleotide-binding domain-containing protein [Magnetospirillum sp. WYHS-4]